MKILRLPPYYEPEQISSSHLSSDLEEACVKEGFKIEVHTPSPTRNVSVDVRKKYKKIKYQEKHGGRVCIYRFFMVNEGRNTVLRALRYAACNIVQYFKGIRAKDVDLILTGNTPPTQGILVSLVKKRLNVPVVYILQDVFPDSLVNAGLTRKGSILFRLGTLIERYTYNSVDKIIVISEDIKKNLLDKGVLEDKVHVILNWVNPNNVIPVSKEDNVLYEKFKLDRGRFYVTYAGNMGHSQNLEVLLKTAKKLQDYRRIGFLIIGSGSQEIHLRKMAISLGLDNISFFPLQPYNLVSHVYSLGDVSIVSCKRGFGQGALPSKTWSIMSAATAVMVSFDENSQLQKIIENAEAGIFTASDDSEGLTQAILKLFNDPGLCMAMGRNGRNYVLNNLSRENGTEKYVRIIKEVAKAAKGKNVCSS